MKHIQLAMINTLLTVIALGMLYILAHSLFKTTDIQLLRQANDYEAANRMVIIFVMSFFCMSGLCLFLLALGEKIKDSIEEDMQPRIKTARNASHY